MDSIISTSAAAGGRDGRFGLAALAPPHTETDVGFDRRSADLESGHALSAAIQSVGLRLAWLLVDPSLRYVPATVHPEILHRGNWPARQRAIQSAVVRWAKARIDQCRRVSSRRQRGSQIWPLAVELTLFELVECPSGGSPLAEGVDVGFR